MSETTYLNEMFLKHMDSSKIQTVFELGSRDCKDAVNLSNYFKSKVYAFECDPNNIKICENTLKNNTHNVILEKYALWHENSIIDFFPVVNGNNGASSCYIADLSYPYERYSQVRISVNSIKLDYYCEQNNINNIDYLCVDLQGAALNMFKGATNILKNTKYICCELERRPLYIGEALFEEVHEFLKLNNFSLLEEKVAVKDYFSDFFYVNNSIGE